MLKNATLNALVCEAIHAHAQFRRKEGFYARPMIWESVYIEQQKSHRWHQDFSSQFHSAFAKVACRVTSKILGIGSAERAWGDVKHLKTGKRSHLGYANIEKASIVYGQSCLGKARIKKEYCPETWNFTDLDDERILRELDDFLKPPTDNNSELLNTDDEEEDELAIAHNNLFVTHVDDSRKIFHAYIEDKERDCYLKRQHDDHFFHLKRKYEHVKYICPDDRKGYTIKEVIWVTEEENRKKIKYYAVRGLSKNPNASEMDRWDKMKINHDLHLQIRICQQDEHLKVVDENGYEVNPLAEIEDNFYTDKELCEALKKGWDAMN